MQCTFQYLYLIHLTGYEEVLVARTRRLYTTPHGFIAVSIKSYRLSCTIFRNIVAHFDNPSIVLHSTVVLYLNFFQSILRVKQNFFYCLFGIVSLFNEIHPKLLFAFCHTMFTQLRVLSDYFILPILNDLNFKFEKIKKIPFLPPSLV